MNVYVSLENIINTFVRRKKKNKCNKKKAKKLKKIVANLNSAPGEPTKCH